MKTAVIGEYEPKVITYNAALVALLNHYGANLRVHATTRCMVNEAFADERPSLKPLPAIAYNAVLTVERRVSKDGMVSAGGNLY